jgi:GT2 family glycosyltransferase
MSEPLVYIIVLNWNGKTLILDCLKSLQKITYPNAKVLVVDNGSTDDSVVSVQEQYPAVEILALPSNLGFAKGNNAGFEFARKYHPQFVIFLNNDTIVDPGFIEPLLQPFKDDSAVGQTVPKIYYADKPNLIWFGGSTIYLLLGLIKHDGIRCADGPRFNHAKEVDYATGCCLCMRTDDYASLNGFDESFPMYSEDVDLSLRLKKMGRKILFIPKSKIWHKVSASVGGSFSFKKWMKKSSAKLKLIVKNVPRYSLVIAIPMTILVNLLELIFGMSRYFWREIK